MKANNAVIVIFLSSVITSSAVFPPASLASPATPRAQDASGQPAVAKRIGEIKAINGNAITLAPDSGPEIAVTVASNAKIARLAGGKELTPIQLQDLQVGDTVRVRGYASADSKSMNGLEVIVITRASIAAVSDQIRQDWQKRGLGGIVASVDAAGGTVTVSIPGFGEKKTVSVRTTSSTVIRRYAPDSASFEAATPSTLQNIHVNDQLRARGDRSADGNEFSAAEIVTGTFPYVEGTVKSVDASANTVSVQDVLSKKTVQLKVTADSQLHQVPADMAQRMAFMLKQAKAGGSGAPAGSSAASGAPPASSQNGVPAGGMGTGGPRGGGGSGFQRMLDSTPAVKLSDLHKGDALAILATEGTASTGGTIIKLYSGVEPILEAAPNAMMLTPWTLGGSPNGGDNGMP